MSEGILIYGAVRGKIGKAGEKIRSVLEDIRKQGFSRAKPFSVGKVEKRMERFAERNGITLAKGGLYMTPSALAHATRDSKKAKGLTVSNNELESFPKRRRGMKLFYDTTTGNFTYMDGKAKYIVHPNYSVKMDDGKKKIINFITASKIANTQEFIMDKYKEIKK